MAGETPAREQLLQEIEALKERCARAEERYRALRDHFPHGLFIKDRNSVWEECNPVMARDMGMTPEDIVGRDDFALFPRELAEKYRADDQRIMASGKPEEFEEGYVRQGRDMRVHTVKVPLRDPGSGEVNGILGVFYDITPHKEAEVLVQRRNTALQAVNRVFQQALLLASEEAFAKACLESAMEATDSRFGFLGELNPAGRYDTIALADPGWAACRIPRSEATLMITDMEVRGLWGRVIEDGASLLTNDPAGHPDSVGIPEDHPPLNAFLGVPLQDDDGRTTGMIALANKDGGYDDADRETVEAMSTAIGEAFRKRRTEAKLAEQAQEILDLSVPVVRIWQGVILAPLIGMLDSQRTQGFMERLLDGIVEMNARVALVDITGVPAVDTQTSQHLVEAITAARLLGAKVILTGVRSTIAQTLVHLGIDLEGMETCASLAEGLERALKRISGNNGPARSTG